MMKVRKYMVALVFLTGVFAQEQKQEQDVPLMRPDEKKVIDAQSADFNGAISESLSEGAKSTVRIWSKSPRTGKPMILSYGTVVGEGNQVLTKWSEVEWAEKSLYVQAGDEQTFPAVVAGVFSDDDLVLLDLSASADAKRPVKDLLTPVKFSEAELNYGRFISATQPNGQAAGFGVVSVLERNLRESDQAHLGIMADQKFRGKGVSVAEVQSEYGAADAGIQAGDIILEIEGREISGLQEMRNALSSKSPGDQITMKIETAGKERSVEVLLRNRPIFGQVSEERLNQMERMGGKLNRVRNGFSRVVQSDMKIQKNQVGGPVVDLQGKIVGITLARADRTRTYLMSGSAVAALLKGKSETVAEAREKMAMRTQQLAAQSRQLMPKLKMLAPSKKPMNPERTQRHLSDLERLQRKINRELEALGVESSP